MAVAARHAVTFVAAAAERGFQLFLEQFLDEAAHLQAHRLLQRIEPIAAGISQRWRHGRGRRSLRHGVGSFSVEPTGTYAALTNSHQPRDTTGDHGQFPLWQKRA